MEEQNEVRVRAEVEEEDGTVKNLRIRAQWEDDLKNEISQSTRFSKKEKIIIGMVILFGALNIILNVLTLGPDLISW